jgi:hypothetical protein
MLTAGRKPIRGTVSADRFCRASSQITAMSALRQKLPLHNGRVSTPCAGQASFEYQLLTIAIETLRISPSDTIDTDCLLPVVVSVRFAENPGASTTTAILPAYARPCTVPLTPRDASLHEPDTLPPSLTTALLSSSL